MRARYELSLDYQIKQARAVKALRAENSRQRAEIAKLKARIAELEADLEWSAPINPPLNRLVDQVTIGGGSIRTGQGPIVLVAGDVLDEAWRQLARTMPSLPACNTDDPPPERTTT